MYWLMYWVTLDTLGDVLADALADALFVVLVVVLIVPFVSGGVFDDGKEVCLVSFSIRNMLICIPLLTISALLHAME